ncbi:MAG: DUF1576 domain-containing protein [Leptotrichiaceae bacterium]|nr:DUF1576 domain-containing protein [Leptotrichiaceae bacterium]MBP6281117.1 DUF1576 domain-containing protein [Leptotrichiaceae bacterium]MBP7100265.1 DUF1576 domain-containing protein [Leptotrichiaceae bacterium]MBP7739272.1 DUF1576 domain-containing protein [Leptotrichiaceae bacterium]MBP9629000.1 DUF1576 domain-containing protein [Leptotrichiaceae bacterium]
MEKTKKKEYLVIIVLPLVMLLYSIFSMPVPEIFNNLLKIFHSNDILLTDYFFIAGHETAIFNASVITLINIFIIYKMDMKINGLIISGIYLMFGFSFIGKNLLNIIPFYLGVFLYSKYTNKTFKSTIIITMFSTALSPFVSSTANYFNFTIFGIFIAFIVGVILGFIVPPVASHTVQFHGGYSLYNTGLAVGLIAIVFYSVIKASGISLNSNNDFVDTLNYPIIALLCGCYLFFIIYGYVKNGYSFKGYGNLIKYSGRLVSDYTVTDGFPIVMINMGILGFLCLIFIFLFFPMINGPVLAGMFTVIAFSGFGKHIKNALPVMIGATAGYYFFHSKASPPSFAITVFFSTTLSPISGKFGALSGILGGFLILCLVSNIGPAHGGLNLYNTGLAGGIVASIFVPLLQLFQKENK